MNGGFAYGYCGTEYGTRCYFTCDAGYGLTNGVLRCDSFPNTEVAFWDGDEPVCEGREEMPSQSLLDVFR